MNFKPSITKLFSYSDFELNSMNYKKALIYDKRTYFQYYISLIKTKHPIYFTFINLKDYNIMIIKICLFFFSFSLNYAFNTFFFDYTIIHNIYQDEGNYNLSYLFPIIFYSFIISYYIIVVIKYLVISERDFLELKNEKSESKAQVKMPKVERCLMIRNISYLICSVIFLFFLWYYLSSFSAIYKNSQLILMENTIFSFLLSLLFPFFYNFIPGAFRLFALNTNKQRECIYKISRFFQIL